MYLLTYFVVNREVGVSKQVQGTVVIDDEGNAVLLVKETTGVTVEDEDGVAVAVQTAVRGVVLGNVLNQQEEPTRAIEYPSRPTPTVVQPSRDVGGGSGGGDECCSCCCVLKWTLLTIFCLPCLPVICICYYCCCDDD